MPLRKNLKIRYEIEFGSNFDCNETLVVQATYKVSAGNSGHPKTMDTWYISAMDKSFGLKILVLKHLPLGYIHTKNEL